MSQVGKSANGRNLALIRESGSTARVLNLALAHDKFGATEEYSASPLFKSRRLNRAVIVKHALRGQEVDAFKYPPICATKVILPFASGELDLGGMSFFVGQTDFETIVRGVIGDDPIAFTEDLELLRLMDSLPSFDPFLTRERLRQSGREPARCYFDVSEADVARMREFVGKEIAELVGLAFANGGAAARDLSEKLADKLMTDETAKSLDPLRELLRLGETEYREGVFAWKGFLYYKWVVHEFADGLETLKTAIRQARPLRASETDKTKIDALRRRVILQVNEAAKRVRENLTGYGVAFTALANGDAKTFREFLLRAPALFLPIGEAIGVVKHIESFWRFRFPSGVPMMEVDEALDLFTEFEGTLASVEFAQGVDLDALEPEPKAVA